MLMIAYTCGAALLVALTVGLCAGVAFFCLFLYNEAKTCGWITENKQQ